MSFMKNETELWLNYATENYQSAEILMESHLSKNKYRLLSNKKIKNVYQVVGYGFSLPTK